jgi:hypothetical protein
MGSTMEAVATFRASADRFNVAVADVSDTTWVFTPSPSVWSMAEVIEHVTMTDRGIRGVALRNSGASSMAIRSGRGANER